MKHKPNNELQKHKLNKSKQTKIQIWKKHEGRLLTSLNYNYDTKGCLMFLGNDSSLDSFIMLEVILRYQYRIRTTVFAYHFVA